MTAMASGAQGSLIIELFGPFRKFGHARDLEVERRERPRAVAAMTEQSSPHAKLRAAGILLADAGHADENGHRDTGQM